MTDEMFDRNYQSARHEMNAGIDRAIGAFVAGLSSGFRALHRAQWQAPWEQRGSARPRRRDAGLA